MVSDKLGSLETKTHMFSFITEDLESINIMHGVVLAVFFSSFLPFGHSLNSLYLRKTGNVLCFDQS